MKEFHIIEQDAGCVLVGIDIHTKTHLPLPIKKEDAVALIRAAFKSDDEHPRAEFQGILADRTSGGVRVRQVAKDHWFDIAWPLLARAFA